MRAGDFVGAKIYRKPTEDKRTKKDGTPRSPKKLGKIHFPVFTPGGTRVVGFMVRQSDIAGMIERPDRFVALDAIGVYEGAIAVDDVKDTYDAAAAKRLDINLDDCIIWVGMDVRTESGDVVGYCSDVEFKPRSGIVQAFYVTAGAASSVLVGDTQVPPTMLRGYADGAMIVSDEVKSLGYSGGAAAKAAEASVVVGDKVKKGAKVLDDKLEEACRYYSELGVAGWKVDFIDRQDQAAVERVYRIADAAARYRMIVDFHGVYKPTGLQRTYPNVVNFEGIFGLEQLKWTDKTDADMPAYDCTFPFIRQVAGPVDYTQGAMRNASRKNFRAVNNHPMSQGTRAHQVATYVVFDSPLVMLCDSPTAYEKEPETLDYIVRFPTRFDQTLIPAGEIGRYIVTARRAGDRWYLGALTNWDAREVEVKLDFLGDGRWKARIFRDGVNADRYGEDYLLEERTVTAADSLAMPMAPGGGYAVQFERVQ